MAKLDGYSHAEIFQEFNTIIQSDNLSADTIKADEKKLIQLIAKMATTLPGELGKYGEALMAVHEALMYLEFYGESPLWMFWAETAYQRTFFP